MPIATKSDFINLSSEKKTEELAEKISKKLKLGHVVFFVGEVRWVSEKPLLLDI